MHTPNPEKLWYYTSQGQTVGPVAYDDFRTAANSGKVDRFQDRAWNDGLADWMAVSEIEGLFTTPPPPMPAPSPVVSSQSRPMTSPAVTAMASAAHPVIPPLPARPQGRVPVTLMTVLFAIGAGVQLIGAGFSIVGAINNYDTFLITGTILSIPAMICIVWFVVLYLMAVYRLWSFIPDGIRRTTPGKAIGFLFIPFFNLYWIFQAHLGLAKDYNRWRQSDPTAPRLKEGLFLTQCILTVCGMIPYVNFLVMIPNMILAFPMFRQVGRAVNDIVARQEAPGGSGAGLVIGGQ